VRPEAIGTRNTWNPQPTLANRSILHRLAETQRWMLFKVEAQRRVKPQPAEAARFCTTKSPAVGLNTQLECVTAVQQTMTEGADSQEIVWELTPNPCVCNMVRLCRLKMLAHLADFFCSQ